MTDPFLNFILMISVYNYMAKDRVQLFKYSTRALFERYFAAMTYR